MVTVVVTVVAIMTIGNEDRGYYSDRSASKPNN